LNVLGLIVFVVGLLGLVAAGIGMTSDMEFLPLSFRGVTPWAIVAGIGGVLFFFTRRARD
jgi:uncharacterized membrane protein YdcZ (DUF606 family)